MWLLLKVYETSCVTWWGWHCGTTLPPGYKLPMTIKLLELIQSVSLLVRFLKLACVCVVDVCHCETYWWANAPQRHITLHIFPDGWLCSSSCDFYSGSALVFDGFLQQFQGVVRSIKHLRVGVFVYLTAFTGWRSLYWKQMPFLPWTIKQSWHVAPSFVDFHWSLKTHLRHTLDVRGPQPQQNPSALQHPVLTPEGFAASKHRLPDSRVTSYPKLQASLLWYYWALHLM